MPAALKPSIDAAPSLGETLVIAGGRPAEAVRFDGLVVDFFVSAADLLGVPKSVAAIYGIVFSSSEPLSFTEIEARLNISKGSISQGLRVLREVGALRAVGGGQRAEVRGQKSEVRSQGSEVGGRRAEASLHDSGAPEMEGSRLRAPICYVPDLELRKLVSRFIEHRLEKQLSAGSAKLATLAKAVPGTGAESAELIRRLESLSDWHSKAKAVLPLVRTVLKIG